MNDIVDVIVINAIAMIPILAAKAIELFVIANKETILSAIGASTARIRKLLPQFFILFIDLLVTAYLLGQLYVLIADPAPPSRADGALAAFWMCVLVWFAKRAFFDPLLRWRRSR